MPHVMQTGAASLGWTTQPDLARQGVEGAANIAAIESVAPRRQEQVVRSRALCPHALTPCDVACEYSTGRRMNRHQTILAELGTADREYPRLQIDVMQL